MSATEHHTRPGMPGRISAPLATRADLLAELRTARGFVASEVLAAKVGRINGWLAANDVDAAVVGLSGGVDSAVTLGLLTAASAAARSPLQRIVALSLPIDGPGATGQTQSAERASLVAASLGAELWSCPLGATHTVALGALEQASGLTFDGWSAGQMLSVERTPLLYGAVALLRSQGHRAVVAGTTNRDEGAYLGFFGKASDGMVDLQPISDLHKSEVMALAELLDVPEVVRTATPSGDVWDGRTDEEMIGASYDEVELVLRLLELGRDPVLVAATLDDGDALLRAARAVERLHGLNRHKYVVGSPAVHLDVMPRGVPGGWADEVVAGRGESRPIDVPGAWDPPRVELDPLGALPAIERSPLVVIARDALAEADCDRLVDLLDDAPLEPVGVTGRRDDAGIGSCRATSFSPALAAELWPRIAPAVPSVRFVGPFDSTDAHATSDRSGHRTWRVVGLSPVLRFMRYEPGGRHLCHYDAGFDYGDGRRSLVSVVFFLTGPGEGGATRFIADGQDDFEVWDRDHRDWDRLTCDDEVVLAIEPAVGQVLLFDHRTCHDIETWHGPGPRVIIRGDIVYEAIPDGRSLP